MGTTVELLKIINKFTKKKIKNESNEDKRKFKEILSEEMKKLNKDHIDTKV